MFDENNWLMHYGIPGQKWGIRRFQNLDRTRTEEGKLRYRESLHRKFDEAEADVRRRASNHYDAFEKRKISQDVVKRRGNLSLREAVRCSLIANKIFNRAASFEPQITRDVVSAVAKSDGKMFGLENRLKQPESLAAKIGQDANEKHISFEEAARKINDTIRYTSIASDSKFTKEYESVKSELQKLGYTEIRCRNYFDLYKQGKVQHKSVQCVFEDSDGNKFELQFHTPSSQAAKELKIPIYEERRNSGVSESRQEALELKMHDLAERIQDPKDVFLIKSHG